MPRVIKSDLLVETVCGAPSVGPDTHILVADDHEINRKVFSALLAFFGGGPTVVNNGAEAVLAWELGDWDLILMDIQMPEMDGVTAARLIRAKELEGGRVRTPIIAVTCNTSPEDAASYRAAGMDELVAKPIQFSLLLAAMERVMKDAPARIAATGYKTLHLQRHAIDDAKNLAAYIARELKRLGIARSKAYDFVAPSP